MTGPPSNPHPAQSRSRAIFLRVLILALVVGALELMAHVALSTAFKDFAHTRRILKGDIEDPRRFQNSIGQAYLLYAPSPGYSNEHGLQHNDQGYRGAAVALAKPPGTLRILCLGGSTTYGWTVGRAGETYPASLEGMLNEELPQGVDRVEVMNGGLLWGTTAEMLTHYHFKYAYYNPDVVILNTGGNDAEAATDAHYHPDYSHYRQQLPPREPLPAFGAFLLKSRVVSLLLVPAVASFQPAAFRAVKTDDRPPDIVWFPAEHSTAIEQLAFRRNLEALIAEIQANGAVPVLVPFRPAPVNEYADPLRETFARNERVLRSLAEERGIPFAPFPAEVISAGNWVDSCHLNAPGAYEKARHLLPYVQTAIEASMAETGQAR